MRQTVNSAFRVMYLATLITFIGSLINGVLFIVAASNASIAEVKLSKHDFGEVQAVLNFLDVNAGVDVFKKTTAFRKIRITEVTEEEMAELVESEKNNYVLGVAEPKIASCEIHILSSLPKKEFFDVLMHEMVHCFGFGHVADSKNLMNAYDEGTIAESSKVEWAKRLGKIVKTLRF